MDKNCKGTAQYNIITKIIKLLKNALLKIMKIIIMSKI